MIVDLITAQNAAANQTLLREMHRQRHRVFKERMGWDVSSVNGEERDQFDRPDTAYLVVNAPDGQVLGSWRLLTTEKDYMASTVFRHLFDGHTPPSAPNVWECSRFAVESSGLAQTTDGIDRATAYLLVSIVECAFTYGIDELVTVEDIAVARLMHRALGMKPSWHGSVHTLGNTRAMVARYPVTGDLVQRLRTKYGAPTPIIRQFGLWQLPEAA
ncbi:putative Conjugation factor synthetase TraI [Magnetospirillum sp. LM-5]|uniref:acyl-homoserine-lactone synthase n=1 Tax=Magnetospirillum sp. LM-5 TaxID=2681466 RepID=UPI0013811313|nr:acyl-homoserine-lactone synthase [Magnetospirillum sp. LM-5]CAA7623848.1 putative Conjugation factor synthetase TraI [Magnetospirillum sp. LM-5]